MSEILLDPRAGSGDLALYLTQWSIPHTLTRLDFGDAAVEAAAGSPIDPPAIGIEIKRVRDALQCMRDGRFAGHQLPGLLRDYGMVWLVIEGPYGVHYDTGMMCVTGKGGKAVPLRLGKNGPGFTYAEFDHWLITLEVKAGIHVRRTSGRVETARFLCDMRTWFEKDWNKHKSHLALHVNRPDVALLTPATTCRKIAAQIPGVGWERSAAIAARCRNNTETMLVLTEKEWREIDGIGPTMAERIWRILHNDEE